MIIDNQTQNKKIKTVYDFIKKYSKVEGEFNIVTGYFTFKALATFFDELNFIKQYRIVIGDLTYEKPKDDKVINFLSPDLSIQAAFKLSQEAKKTVEFIKQQKVKIKTVKNKLCHAKTYIYKSPDNEDRDNYFIIGSSNLTHSGLKIERNSPYANIELNQADTGLNSDYEKLQDWFKKLWQSNDTTDKTTIDNPEPDKKKKRIEIEVKQFLIDYITNFFKTYTPEELYYKVLYELFKKDITDIEDNDIYRENVKHLEETIVYNKLYPFQKKGVLSLIRMLQQFGGAILADAVGLGKTWQALAVIKFFELQGYETLVLCPKKLGYNWERYHYSNDSLFRYDRLHFNVRYHTDLQINTDGSHRLDKPKVFKLRAFQKNPKFLVVIDESHNLRNDKSQRYQYLVDNILQQNKDVKVLMLSATPINNQLTDIRNQFKLMVRGEDNGFENAKFEIRSLHSLFSNAQKIFNEWQKTESRKISTLIADLQQEFFELTDELIVARTRKMIENNKLATVGEAGKLDFPNQKQPDNKFIPLENIGNLKSFDEILNLLEVNLTAYKPTHYTEKAKPKSILEDNQAREGFLVKMMYILMVKRMESSWYSFKSTVDNILKHHINALNKIENFEADSEKTMNEMLAEIENNISDEIGENEEFKILTYFENSGKAIQNPVGNTLGKKNPIRLSEIKHKEDFIKHLKKDINLLSKLASNLNIFKNQIANETSSEHSRDKKLESLMQVISEKQKLKNKKIVLFTVFADTANYIYNELKKRGFEKLALVTGQDYKCEYSIEPKRSFEPILERFAPYTKLFREQDWTELYEKNKIENIKEVDFAKWQKLIEKYDKKTLKKLNEPIEILIATDCLSEGQNLQDADMVINYDVHWNPVRLVQRLGRIDRIGSPNKEIQGVNYWPSKNLEDYLNLKNRVENRMALMTVVGAEIPKLTKKLKEQIKENPLISEQTERMLKQLETSWKDIENGEENFSLSDLSLEDFRMELREFLDQYKEQLEKIPNGVFSGFKLIDELKQKYNGGLLALIGYPQKPAEATDFSYEKVNLIYADRKSDDKYIINNFDALKFLKEHKKQDRYVPENIEQGKESELDLFKQLIEKWMQKRKGEQATTDISGMLKGTKIDKVIKKDSTLEKIYKPENWDLIVWFAVS